MHLVAWENDKIPQQPYILFLKCTAFRLVINQKMMVAKENFAWRIKSNKVPVQAQPLQGTAQHTEGQSQMFICELN